MRRFGLFAGFLLLLGLTSAVAASFDVQAEDVTSFSTPVSITVPPPPGLVTTYVLRESSSTLPGLLDTNVGPDGSSVQGKVISGGSASLTNPATTGHHHSWQTPALAADLVLDGLATLWIEKNQPTRPLTAGIFDCPPPSDPDLPPVPIGECTLIGGPGTSINEEGGGGIVLREVPLGHLSNQTVPAGNHLRLQIVNLNASNQSFNIQWGYRDNRQARLEVTVVSP